MAVAAGVGVGATALVDHFTPGHPVRYAVVPAFAAAGGFFLSVVWLKWDWFYRGWRRALAKRLVGDKSARITYTVVGVVLLFGSAVMVILPALAPIYRLMMHIQDPIH
jgi:hypothetical protein